MKMFHEFYRAEKEKKKRADEKTEAELLRLCFSIL